MPINNLQEHDENEATVDRAQGNPFLEKEKPGRAPHRKKTGNKKSTLADTNSNAYTAENWSLARLCVEFDLPRENLKRQLAGLSPRPPQDGQRAGQYYLMKDVVSHMMSGAGVSNERREKARLAKLRADDLEQDMARKNGELLTVEEAKEIYGPKVVAFRKGMMAVPGLADQYRETVPAREFYGKVETAVRTALEELGE